MHHPSESDLALYAGNDLGRLARMRVDWHLRTCGKCQQEVTDFSSLRAETLRNTPEPEVNWDRLAAEMKANIRLGLEAGKCIAPAPIRHRSHWPLVWVGVATAAIMLVAAAGEIWFQRSSMPDTAAARTELATIPRLQDVVLEVKGSGIRMRDGEAVVNEFDTNSRGDSGDVAYTVNAQGGVGASYVDRDTGMVTVNNIYYGQ